MTSTTSTLSFDMGDMFGDKGKKKNKHKKHGWSVNVGGNGTGRTSVRKVPRDIPQVQYPTATAGALVPYMIGRQRVFDGNVVWFGNLDVLYETEKVVHTDETPEDVDEDGYISMAPSPSIVEETFIVGYRLDVHVGICLGPDVVLREIYIDNAKKWEGTASGFRTVINNSALSDNDFWGDMIFYDGRFDQNLGAGGEVIGIDPPGYVGIAMISISGANATDTFPPLSFEVERHPNPFALAPEVNVNDKGDINPMTAAWDVITNPWGGSGVDDTVVDEVSFTAAATRLAEEGIFLSIYNREPTSAAAILDDIEDMCFCKFFQDPETNVISVKLIRYDLYDLNALPTLNPSNCSNLRDFGKSSWANAFSRSVGSFTSRDKNYEEDTIMALSPQVSGSSREEDTANYSYPMAMDATVAGICLARDSIIMNQPSWVGELQSNRVAANLLPGDGFLLTWPEHNIENLLCVVDYRRDISGDVGILVRFSEVINPNGSVLYALPEPSLFVPVDKDARAPVDAKVMSAPYWIQARIYNERAYDKKIRICTPLYLVEPYNKVQKSFDVRMLNYPNYESLNAGDEPIINKEALYASVGYLVNDLDAIDGFSNGIAAEVLLNGVVRPQYIKPTGVEGIREGSVWAIVDDEIMSFELAENSGPGLWTLMDVHRGLLDTSPADHAAGSKVWIINGNWEDRIGMTFDIEPEFIPELMFCSRTPDKRQKDDGLVYSDWSPDARINKPIRPMATTINGSRGSGSPVNVARSGGYTIGWKTRSRVNVRKVAVYATPAQKPEESASGVKQTHTVYLTDSANTTHNLGATGEADPENTLDVTIPGGAATGVGYIWVQANARFGNSIQAEHYPVNVT